MISDAPRRAIKAVLALLTITPMAQAEYQYGSGFVVHPDGYVLTNHHVVDSADAIVVATSDGKRFPAQVVRFDKRKDLALLKIEAANLPVLPLGISRPVRVLDSIVAVGFPYADRVGLELSAYDGKVNSIRESGETPLIQMDASVNQGSSGGPVLNDHGQVIGVTVSKFDAVRALLESGDIPERMNFAIPIGEAKGVLSDAFPFGYVEEPELPSAPPADIFEAARSSVVLVVSRVAETAQEQAIPIPKAEAIEPPGAVPPPIAQLVLEFISASNSDTSADVRKFFAEFVDYMDEGMVEREFILSDHGKHQARWPKRSYRLKGPTRWSRLPEADTWLVEYDVEFTVENKTQVISGDATTRALIRDGDSPGIIGIKEEVTRRNRTTK